MPLPAGSGMDRRSFLLRSAGAVLSVYGAAALSPRHFEEGIAAGRRRVAAEPAGARLDLHGRRLGRAVGARAGQGSQVPRTAPAARTQGRRRRTVHRGRNPDVASAGRRPRPAARRGQGHRRSRRSATTRRTRAISRAATTGRSANSTRRRARAGWAATWTSRANPGNPLQGLSLDYSLAPALATTRVPVAAVSTPVGLQLLGLRAGGTADLADARRVRGARRARRALARPRTGAHRLARHEHHPQPGRAVRRTRRQTGLHLARHLSDDAAATSRRGWPRSRRCSTTKRCRSNASR